MGRRGGGTGFQPGLAGDGGQEHDEHEIIRLRRIQRIGWLGGTFPMVRLRAIRTAITPVLEWAAHHQPGGPWE